MVTLKHDSHDHKLDLTEVDDHMVGKGKCGICEMPIAEASSIYKCLEKDCPNNSLSIFYFLHKTCAELPDQITHPHHPQHLLVLSRGYNQELRRVTKGSYPRSTACNLCLQDINEQMWNYMCVTCHSAVQFTTDRCATTLLASGENEIKYEAEAEPEGHGLFPDLLQFPLPCTDSLVANLLANYQSGKPFLAKKNKKSGKPLTNTDPMKDKPVPPSVTFVSVRLMKQCLSIIAR
ncbi:hypothetical protein ACET3Z_012802 [Daucus carota]